jgi:predicted enzyme related to lactoylglutathione lyase
MSPPIVRIILYVRDIPKVAAFYQEHFGLLPLPSLEQGWLELQPESGGCTIALHQASKAQKSGSAVKITFGVADVRGFVAARLRAGLKFGPIHAAEGFEYANARDPAGNSISVSSRGLEKAAPPEL